MGIEEAVKNNYKAIGKIFELQGFNEGKLNLLSCLYDIKENIADKAYNFSGYDTIIHNWFEKKVNSEDEFIEYLNKNKANLGKKIEKALLQPRYENCLIQSKDNDFYLLEINGDKKDYLGGFKFAFHNPKQ